MKKIFVFFASLLMLVSCADKYADELQGIRDRIDEVNQMLNQLCEQTNANLSSLQTIVKTVEINDYITYIDSYSENGKEVGYKINFFKSEPIIIYNGTDGVNGKDGVDGSDGADGKDGLPGYVGKSLEIGVKLGNDGKWYWTVDGVLLRDANGNKVPASPMDGKDGADGADGVDGTDGKDGADGKDGENGTDGKDGAPGPDGAAGPVGAGGVNGKDGKDGVTPLMEIRDGYWYLSVDNGLTWTQYGKATGKDGNPGADGVVPEVIISSVTWNQNTAYFTLKTGEVIAIPIKRPFEITLAETTDILIEAGGTILIEYIILGADDDTKVYCICEGGWKAEVQEEDFFSGNIVIRAPYPYSEGKVLVMAQNADDNLVIQKLTFREV